VVIKGELCSGFGGMGDKFDLISPPIISQYSNDSVGCS
jgi:hypothetical protein